MLARRLRLPGVSIDVMVERSLGKNLVAAAATPNF